MRILFLADNFPPETNAAATRVYERACYWASWGHDVTVITCAPNFPRGKLLDGYSNLWHQVETMAGIRVVRVKTFITKNEGVVLRSIDFLSFFITGTLAALGERRPDVVVATSPQFFVAVAGWMVGALRKIPFVFELGDLWPASISAVGAIHQNIALRWLERFELFLYRQSACVISLTPAFKRNLVSRGTSGDKIAVIINGVDLFRYSPRLKDEALMATWNLHGCFVVGYVGTHGMAHGLGNVLSAAELLSKDKTIVFMLAGSGAERTALMTRARQQRLNNVIFVPPQPKDQMPAVWSICDIALVHLRDSPAFSEVIPSKMFEAMGMGLPLLLAAPKGEASRILAEDGAGLWVPAENPAELAKAIQRLARTNTKLREYAKRSLAAAPIHTRERQAKRMIHVLEMVVQGRGHEVGAAVLL